MTGALTDLDAAALLAAATEAQRESRLADVRGLEVLSAWAGLHSSDPTEGPDGRAARRMGNVLRQVGGDGTPGVQDFCLGEIAWARGASATSTQNALADVLDLEHRLPLTWAVCRRGECEVWVARKVARMSRHLARDRVGLVDRAVSRMIASEGAGRVLAVAEAKVIEADTELHEERREEERRRRYVGLGRTDEYGLRTLIARLEAGDAAAVDAVVHRVAEIIAPRHPEAHPDELRAIAFGWLARPAELFVLLLEHTEDGGTADAEPAPMPDAAESDGEPEPDEPSARAMSRALAFPADLLDALRSLDLRPLARRRSCTSTSRGRAPHEDGVVRIEGLGPVTLTQLAELLRRHDLKVQPVKDLSGASRYTAYEHPESLRDQVHLVNVGDYWPFAHLDQPTCRPGPPHSYDHGDEGRDPPPDQTAPQNSGPLGRRHHRWKTHAGFRSRQCGEGRVRLAQPERPGLPRRPHRHPPDSTRRRRG